MKNMYEIVWNTLLRLGQGPNGNPYSEEAAKISFKMTGGIDKVQILPEDKDPSRWLPQATLKPIKDFFPEGSSVSVIRYFAASDQETNLHSPCDEHFDTGVLTLIMISEVPGLEVQDQKSGKWLELEKLGTPGDLVVIMGRKVEMLFSKEANLKPTFHRVRIPKNVERHSILFFFDLPSGPDKD